MGRLSAAYSVETRVLWSAFTFSFFEYLNKSEAFMRTKVFRMRAHRAINTGSGLSLASASRLGVVVPATMTSIRLNYKSKMLNGGE